MWLFLAPDAPFPSKLVWSRENGFLQFFEKILRFSKKYPDEKIAKIILFLVQDVPIL